MIGRSAATFLFVGVVVVIGARPGRADEKVTLTVGAAASLTDALTAIGKDYEARHPGSEVQFRFGASSLVARQIEEGAPADLFFSADDRAMQRLADRGLIVSRTRRQILSNRLVIIAPDDRPLTINAPKDILQADVTRIAVCDPVAPIGAYTKAYLDREGLYERARPRFVVFDNVRATLAAVEGGNVTLGFVYRTDAAVSRSSRIVFTVPEGEGPQIRYPAAVLRDSPRQAAAKAFLEYLSGPDAAARFREFGFEVIGGHSPGSQPASKPIAAVMTGADVWRITLLSLQVACVATLLVAIPGIWLGHTLARRRFPGRNLVRTVVVLPMVFPPVATGFLLLLLLSRRGPIGGTLGDVFGVQVVYTWWAAALAAAVVAFPLLVRSAEAAFAEVPARLLQMSATLGSGRRRVFFTVALPLARRGVAYGLLLAFARSVGEFGATAVIAGVGRGTETLALGIWNQVLNSHDTAALTLMGVSAGLAFAAMFCCEVLLRPRRQERQGGDAP